jgi:trehalose 6-phosphate phosphatase
MIVETETTARPRLEACTKFALAKPRQCALFLDVDGTLLELAATPKTVWVPDGLVDLLGRLAAALDGALAIISGRRIGEIDRLLAPLRLIASGVHGSELRMAADDEIQHLTPVLAPEMVAALKELAGRTPGAFAEPKGSGLAIHYRLAPAAEATIEDDLRKLLDRQSGAFDLWPGQKVFEVIPAGFSKGTALATLAALPTFQGRLPIMIGDDIGDEPAFAAAERLQGFALRVAGENYAASSADFEGPQAVYKWLDRLSRRLAVEQSA